MQPTMPPSSAPRAYPLVAEAAGLIEEGRFEAAAQVLIRHLRQYPEEPRGLAELGHAAMMIGALGQAEQFLRKALARGQNDLRTRRHLASVINQQERLVEAEKLFGLLHAETGDESFRGIRAHVLDKLGRHEEALAIQQDMADRDPGAINAQIALGHGLRAAGRIDEAIAAYRRAIAIDPEFGESWWALANIRSKVITDEDVSAMAASLDLAVDERNLSPLHFAMARALHERGDFENAFAHYAKGNAMRAQDIGYEASALSDEVDETIARLNAVTFSSWPCAPVGDAPAKDRPVFIVSLPRSGSTLLERMLTGHPDIEALGELPYLPALLRTFLEISTRRGNISVPEAILGMPDALARKLGEDYLARAAQHRRGNAAMFLDKLPHNWSNIAFIRRILPQARFIDIRRPAMDCCFSNYIQSFTRAHAASFRLGDIAACYRDYVKLMDHFDTAAPGLVHHLRYEDLIASPQPALSGVLDYLGLAWDDALLAFHERNDVVRTPSSEQVRRPLNRDGMDIWRPYAPWLDDLREALGPLAPA